jgi:hypothetical protein
MYMVWHDMVRRCSNPKHQSYKDYGGRGITVCARWLSFTAFCEDMGPRPQGMELERVKNHLGYSLDNCRWATRREQNNNTRSNIVWTFNNKTQTMSQWAQELNMKVGSLRTRVFVLGWSIERALTTPMRRYA